MFAEFADADLSADFCAVTFMSLLHFCLCGRRNSSNCAAAWLLPVMCVNVTVIVLIVIVILFEVTCLITQCLEGERISKVLRARGFIS